VLEALRARGTAARALVLEESRSIVEAFGAEPVVGDVTDAGTWHRAARGVTAIVHAAARVVVRASFDEYTRVNVGGTRLAIESARREQARLIHVSSVSVYGRAEAYAAGKDGVTEDFPFQPLAEGDYYARTKRAADELVRSEAAAGGLTAVVFRPNVIYGERDRVFTPRVIAAVRRRIMPQIGSGTNLLSCVYAGNVASAIVAALEAPIGAGFHAYLVTRDAPPPLSQREFLSAFAEALGVRVRFVPVPVAVIRAGVTLWGGILRALRPGRYAGLAGAAVEFVVGENPFRADRIRAELGWTPPFDARSGIARSVNKKPGTYPGFTATATTRV
jgi:nucleoside-diphosphate-sugar epimerase